MGRWTTPLPLESRRGCLSHWIPPQSMCTPIHWVTLRVSGLIWIFFLLAGSTCLACSLPLVTCVGCWARVGRRTTGEAGASVLWALFQKAGFFAITLESSLAAAAESAHAMSASISLLQGTFPHMYQETCSGISKQHFYTSEKWEII